MKLCLKYIHQWPPESMFLVKWEKHKAIQRMETAIPNTFRREPKYDAVVKTTTGYDVDQEPCQLNSNILDGNFLGLNPNQEELPVVTGIGYYPTRGEFNQNGGFGKELMEDIQKSEPQSFESISSGEIEPRVFH